MTVAEIQKLVSEYTNWLKESISLRQVDEWVEITTPFLDRHNDYIQIFVKKTNGSYLLTDDGFTIQDLKLSGCVLDTPKRQDLLMITLNGFGVTLDHEMLTIKATEQNFSLKKHNLVQAILAVNDLFYLAEPVVVSLFLEDVETWLNNNDIRYSPRVKLSGKSGYDHHFDFVIPKSRIRPERILQAINNPNRNNAENFVFTWIDTKDARPLESNAYAILNDTDRRVPNEVQEALTTYEIHPILWSKKENFLSELSA